MIDAVAPSQLTVVTTSACNLACSYCYQDAKGAERMAPAMLRRAVDALLATGHRTLKLNFHGGEPLLEFEAIRRTVEYAERRLEPGRRFRWHVTTNGTRLSGEILDFLVAKDFAVRWSFDGPPAAQAYRSARSFASLDATLRRLARDYPAFLFWNVEIGITVHRETVDRLPESVRYFLDRGVTEIAASPATVPREDPEDDPRPALRGALGSLVPMLAEHHDRADHVPFVPLRPRGERDRAPRRICGAGTPDSLSLRPDGTVEGCVAVSPRSQRFGSAAMARQVEALGGAPLEEGLAAAARRAAATHEGSPLFRDRATRRSRYGACRDCPYLSRCHVCPAGTLRLAGNTDPLHVPAFSCAWQTAVLEARDALQARIGVPGMKLRIVPPDEAATSGGVP